MEVIIGLDNLLARQREIFTAYTSSGRETDLLPLLDQYSMEDRQVYTIEKAYRYLLLYTTSKNIRDEELVRINELQKIDPNLIFKRGKKIIQILIKSNNDQKQLYLLAASFAKIDGRINPYPVSYVKKALEYYITHSKNHELIGTYYAVVELTKNSENREFNLSLIEELIKLNNIVTAVAFIKNINISDVRLNNLVNSYCVLYPANTDELMYLKQLMALYKDNSKSKIIPEKEIEKRISIKKLKRILEDYLISDIEDIKEIFAKYEVSEYEFNEALKDIVFKNDPILISLIDKYNIKKQLMAEYRHSLIKNIGNSIISGINYGNGFREYNEYDFLVQSHNLSITTICEIVKEIFTTDESDYIINVLMNLDLTPKYTCINDLSSRIGVFSKKGRNLTDKEKDVILSFIEENKFPINNSVFFATCERYFNEDLVLDCKKTL